MSMITLNQLSSAYLNVTDIAINCIEILPAAITLNSLIKEGGGG